MKKTLLSILTIMVASVGFSQVHFSEDFESGLTNWTLADGDTDVSPAGTSYDDWYGLGSGITELGAMSAVSRSWAANVAYNPNNFMTSQAIDLTSVVAAGLTLNYVVGTNEAVPYHAEHYAVYVSTANDTTSILATTPVLEETLPAAGFNLKTIDLAAYAGQIVYITFRHFNTFDMNTLFVDNIEVLTVAQYDMTTLSISTPAYTAAATEVVAGVIGNAGYDAVTSFTLNYKVNNGTAVTSPVTGVNIASNGTYTFSHLTPMPVGAGANVLEVWATNINGANPDGNTANDVLSKTINKISENVQRVPLLEVFTSSTCAPCTPGNINFDNIMGPIPTDDFVSVKYQQNFPGTGDPYCTAESVNRRGFYAINSIPRMEIDGGWDGNASSFTTALFNSAKAVPAFFKLEGTYTRTPEKKFAIKVKYSPLVDAAGTKLYVAIIEKKTTANVKSNGETEFHDVMKKMVPTNTGTAIPAVAVGAWDSISMTYEFNGAYTLPADGTTANQVDHTTANTVEEFGDTYVVAWVQKDDFTVMQAARLTATGGLASIDELGLEMENVTVYPNPSNGQLNVRFDSKLNSEMQYMLVDLTGRVVYSSNEISTIGMNEVQINTANLNNGMYNLLIFDGQNNSHVESVKVQH